MFAKLMMKGKVQATLRIVAGSCGSGSLPLNEIADPNNDSTEMVREILLKKHPPRQPPNDSSLLEPDFQRIQPPPVMFDAIDGELIHSDSLKMDGAAGPSGLDAAAWKCMCCFFKTTSAGLCESIASTARRLCSEYVDLTCRVVAKAT